MHAKDTTFLPTLALVRFSAHDDGMHVEAGGGQTQEHQPLITFRADETLGFQVVLHRAEGDVSFPLDELKRAIEYAEQEVHPESFYDSE